MRVIIACEESQIVCKAMRKLLKFSQDSGKIRSKTFPGIANAISKQWTN
jgi:hypothetical protein